jgi:hypothetical protein
MAHTASRFSHITAVARNDMAMKVHHGLSSDSATIHAEVVTARSILGVY